MRAIKPLAALFLAMAPLGAQVITVQPSGSAPVTETRTVPLPSGSRLKVENLNGPIKVEAWDRTEVQFTGAFKASSEGEQVQVVLEPVSGGLEIRGVYPKRHGTGFYRGPQCDMTLKVPRQVRPSLETVNGAIELKGTEGEATLSTVNGGLTAKDLSEALEARTTNGSIDLDRVAGPLNLHTVNGSIQGSGLDGKGGGIKAGTVNGGIHLRLTGLKGHLKASTVNGRIAFKAQGAGQVEVAKHHVRAAFPGGDQAIDLSTVNGAITLD
ncbi:MAG TPA: DUF4097 family beta strand repeat-containing protein [Holophagaceae bacterium]